MIYELKDGTEKRMIEYGGDFYMRCYVSDYYIGHFSRWHA